MDIPATVELAATAQDLKYTLTLENDEAFIPDGKKVSVTIESAGYPGTLNKFAVWDSKNLNEASYEIYYSDRMSGGRYNIGDEIVYSSVEPGTYNGVINYGIALADET